MITVKSKIDIRAQAALLKKPKIICIVAMIIGIVGLLAYLVLSILFEDIFLEFLLISAIPFAIGLIFLLGINNSMKNAKNIAYVNEYTFSEDAVNVVSIKNDEVIGTHKLYYNEIVKLKETPEFIFIFITRSNAYVIDKSQLTDDMLTAIKNLILKPIYIAKKP